MTIQRRSKIPPGITQKLEELSHEDGLFYLQDLIVTYKTAMERVDKVARLAWREWASKQRTHFESLILELEELYNAG